MLVAMRRSSVNACSRIAGSKLRMVPINSTCPGMMLERMPPLIMPKLSTIGCTVRFIRRLTMLCAAVTMSDAATIGSMPSHGRAPWVCLPLTTILNESAAAMNGPLR